MIGECYAIVLLAEWSEYPTVRYMGDCVELLRGPVLLLRLLVAAGDLGAPDALICVSS